MTATAMTARLQRAWQSRGWLVALLWPLSMVFRALVALRRLAYERGWRPQGQLPVPVIVVGNVVAGGAGKTPVVVAVVRHLRERGLRVGVVSRGHGRQMDHPAADTAGTDCMEVLPSTPPALSGDEPALIRRAAHAPVVVGIDRVGAAQTLLHKYPHTQVIVSDDGLQHLRLPRCVEICVFDDRGAGNGLLLPAGMLREPWPRRPWPGATALVLQRGGAVSGFELDRRLAGHALSVDGIRIPLAELAALAAQPLVAVAGIARPEVFFAMLQAAGLPLNDTQAQPDHYDFNSWVWPCDNGKTVVCTEKDAIKLWALRPQAAVFAVPLELQVPDAFWTVLDQAIPQGLITP
ncbi:MAG: hypothetical protein RLZZ126_1198 [Pseudomonadota bacterium]|jgi:tetraacyldisaccharide 4'-kinase